MAKSSKTVLRVIRGTIGTGNDTFDTGQTFVAEDLPEGVDVARLVRLGVVEIVSQAKAAPEPVGYTQIERQALDAQIAAAIGAANEAAASIHGIPGGIETLADVPQIVNLVKTVVLEGRELAARELSTRERSQEISRETIAARSQTVRALSALGVAYDDTLSAPQLAGELADAAEAYVRKSREQVLQDAIKAAAGAAQPSGEAGIREASASGTGPAAPVITPAPDGSGSTTSGGAA